MSGYWIADPNGGTKALVDSAEQRDRWTQVYGWAEASEPVGDERVWVHNPGTGGRSVLPKAALDGTWSGLGWEPSAPSEPVDTTKDPALVDQPPQPAPAAATTTKETKSRG